MWNNYFLQYWVILWCLILRGMGYQYGPIPTQQIVLCRPFYGEVCSILLSRDAGYNCRPKGRAIIFYQVQLLCHFSVVQYWLCSKEKGIMVFSNATIGKKILKQHDKSQMIFMQLGWRSVINDNAVNCYRSL